MKKIPYTTRTGAKQFKPQATEAQVLEGNTGFCLACGTEADSVEPDARKYTCQECGAAKVYGLQELALMGLLVLAGGRRRSAEDRA